MAFLRQAIFLQPVLYVPFIHWIKKVGEAIQVIGYENTNVCLCTSPLLSSIARPLEEMVDWTTQLLFQEVQGDKTAPRHVLLKNSFVPRETTQWK
ncbi:substrate-binding domain-containing protein [Enterococcus casseliflavus]|uniref:substrate-binding domain-containing protein n=1 Tax=Enterococcus casseliflavus TaxID=37734 RepID=UPI003D0AE4AC